VRVGLNLTQFVPGRSGGVQTYVETLVRALVRHAPWNRYVLFVNHLTTPLFEDLRGTCELVSADVHIPRLARMAERVVRGAVFRAYALGLDRLMRASRLDVLHFPQNFIVPFRYPGRTVVTFHDLQQEYHPEFFDPAELRWRARNYRPSARRATHLVAISHFTARSLVERYGIDPAKVTVVHTAVDEDVRAPPRPASDAPALPARYFCYPAAFWPHKNHVRLLRAIARLRAREGFDLPLVLTGMDAGDAAPVRRELVRLGLEGQVVMLGYVPRAEFLQLLRGAEFMVFPSLFEGFGIPVAEAMAVGCPVACARASSLPELVGGEGLTFDPGRVEEIARAISLLAKDPVLRRRLVERLARRAERFTPARMATATAAVYERVAARVARAPTTRSRRGSGAPLAVPVLVATPPPPTDRTVPAATHER
jgi:glycosyltransferase involved in cell wall biosynthesis